MEKPVKVLVLDDDPAILKIIEAYLKNQFLVKTASRPSEALEIFKKNSIDIFISDIRLPEMDGLSFIKEVKKFYPEVEIIMISSHAEMNDVIAAMRSGAFDFFKKPFDVNDLRLSIERTLKYKNQSEKLRKSEATNERLSLDLHEKDGTDIVSKSKSMEKIKQTMFKVAQTSDTSVLITGESGTGKELVARGIHLLSKRKDNYFGAVNTSAIPENLFESEFFGHKKGAFTGAIKDKAGWFEVANKGTLFLDEIGDMPVNLQIKLLRVLEDRKYIKVGNTEEKAFDIRIIAATNKDVEKLKNSSDFRADLFYRIGTFEINIPPLRKRKEDIVVLTEYFLLRFADKMKKNIKKIDSELLDVIVNYSFPGNVRELRNLCERAVILSENNTVKLSHFPEIKSIKPKTMTDLETFNLEEIEKQTIIRAMEKSSQNISAAAKLLGIQWNALYRRLQKYGLH